MAKRQQGMWWRRWEGRQQSTWGRPRKGAEHAYHHEEAGARRAGPGPGRVRDCTRGHHARGHRCGTARRYESHDAVEPGGNYAAERSQLNGGVNLANSDGEGGVTLAPPPV